MRAIKYLANIAILLLYWTGMAMCIIFGMLLFVWTMNNFVLGKARAQQQAYPLPKPGQTVIYPNGGTATTLPTGTTVFSNGQTAVPVGPNTYFSNGVICMPVGNNIVCQ